MSKYMRTFLVSAITFAWTQHQLVTAFSHDSAPNLLSRRIHVANPKDVSDQAAVPTATFTQLIDHDNPDLGTFEQLYYYSDEFWKGPGSPVVLFTPGEANVTGYETYASTGRTTGVIAKEIGAAVIVIEHRYWGTSTPYTNLSTANLQYLTLKNSISDMVNFAKTAKLPFDQDGSSQAAKAPWVFVGGSYSGALSAWIASTSPGTFWAYYASSAPVQAMDYWEYFVPVQEGMPRNCSLDVSRVIDYVDAVGLNGTAEEKTALQAKFSLQGLAHYDDFASALQNGPWQWQNNQFYSDSSFMPFCDAVEGATASSAYVPSADGVGLEKALDGYATWFTKTLLPGYCAALGYAEWQASDNTDCFDTYNASSPIYTDWTLSNNIDRQWTWMTCNEPFGYWQDAAPPERPSIVSRLVTKEYWTRQCGLYFPEIDGKVYGLAAGKTYDDVNQYTGGWNIKDVARLTYVNGELDPWREAGVSSEFRPDGPLQSTAAMPVNIVPGGFHTSDLVTNNGAINPGCKKVIDAAVKVIVDWVAEWPGNNWT